MVGSGIGNWRAGVADIAGIIVYGDTLIHSFIADAIVAGIPASDRTAIGGIARNTGSVNAIVVGGTEVSVFASHSIRNIVSVAASIGLAASSSVAIVVEVGAIDGGTATHSVGALVVLRTEEIVVAVGSIVEIDGYAGVRGFIATSGYALSIEGVAKRNCPGSACA